MFCSVPFPCQKAEFWLWKLPCQGYLQDFAAPTVHVEWGSFRVALELIWGWFRVGGRFIHGWLRLGFKVFKRLFKGCFETGFSRMCFGLV